MPIVARIAVILLILFSYSSFSHATTDTEKAAKKMRTEWATIKYKTTHKKQLRKLEKLIDKAEQYNEHYPDDPNILLWYGVILDTYGTLKAPKGLASLKQSRDLLTQAIEFDPAVGEGLAESVLGSLYSRSPSWPIGFGNKQKAKQHLERAIHISPEGMDTNYYLGDFLIDTGNYAKAKEHLDIALEAPIRPGYETQDAGRQKEIKASLAKLKKLRR